MISRCAPLAYVFGLAVLLAAPPTAAQLRGHGGPVRALAVSQDGITALSGSFDSSAILWDLRRGVAEQVLRGHDGAVNSVALLPDARLATAGEDGRIALWTRGQPAPDAVLAGHAGPVAGLAVSSAGELLASASWDHTVRLWLLAGGEPTVLAGHAQNVNGVAFLASGRGLISAGYDATVRIWPLPQPASPIVVELPVPLNAVAAAPDGEIAAAGADGRLYLLSASGERRRAIEAAAKPLVALTLSPDGMLAAAASIDGAIAIIDRKARRVMRTLPGGGTPVWSLAFLPDNRTLLAGGGDHAIRRWDSESGTPLNQPGGDAADPLAAYAGDPGARVFRACTACHALTADADNRAGPSLHGIFGRHIASLSGYNYSDALKRLDIVWTPQTLSELFEIGPSHYTPGTKMPEQRIGSREEREALVRFLERATR